jgi:hypothetical protein
MDFDLDQLRPLKWRHFPGAPGWHVWAAYTPVAQYQVVQWNDRFRWSYAYYMKAESKECESLEVGMEAAAQHWKNLVRQIVQPRGPEGEFIKTEPFDD